MRSWSGLAIGVVIGLAVGAGAMYLGLEQPWRGGTASITVDGGVADAGAPAVAKKKGKKRRRGGRSGGGGGGGTEVAADPAAPALTAADLKMSWKGDAMERPPATLDMAGDGDEGRALGAGEIQATIDRDGAALERCVEQALGGAVWTGEITVQVLVDGGGRAGKARVRAPAFMHRNDLLACARGATRRLGFPSTGGYTVVTVPMPIEF